MPLHPVIDREAVRGDLDWVWSHTVPGQLSHLASTYQDIKSGDYSSARAKSAFGLRIGAENLAIGVTFGVVGGASVRTAVRIGMTPVPLTKRMEKGIFYGRLLNEYLSGNLTWHDIPRFAAPWVLSAAWGRYTIPKVKSSSVARRGNAVGPGGGTKKKSRKKGRVKRYRLPVDSSKAFGRHNPCSKGYFPKKIKGRWYCVLK